MLVFFFNGSLTGPWGIFGPFLLMLLFNTGLFTAAWDLGWATAASLLRWVVPSSRVAWGAWVLAGVLGYALLALGTPGLRSRGGVLRLLRGRLRSVLDSWALWRRQARRQQEGGGGAQQQQQQQQQQQRRQDEVRDQVSSALQKLPVERHMMEEDLSQCSVHALKARLTRRGVECSRYLEKAELVARLAADGGSSAASCCVCCEAYAAGDAVRVLPCSHRFHLECVDQWLYKACELRRPPACPLCNAAVLGAHAQPPQPSQPRAAAASGM